MANQKISEEVATGTVVLSLDPANYTYLPVYREGLTSDQGALPLDHETFLLAFTSKFMQAMGSNAGAADSASLHYRTAAPFYQFIPSSPLGWATKEELWARSGSTSKAISSQVLLDSQVPTVVAYASTLAIDLDTGQDFSVAVTANMTIDIPTNLRTNKQGVIILTMNGAYTIAFAANSNIIGRADVVFPSGAGSRIEIAYRCISATQIAVGTFVSLDT